MIIYLHVLGPPSVVPRPAVSASPGNLFKMQFSGPTRPTEPDMVGGDQQVLQGTRMHTEV